MPCAKLTENGCYSIINDYIGRPILAFNEKGEKVWQTDYDIYGGLRNLKGDRTFIPFRQLGQYEDVETGLYYNRFRYYDCNTGTYISKDPIGLAGGLALYAYVKDSNRFVDVWGLNPLVGLDLSNMTREQIKEFLSQDNTIKFRWEQADSSRIHWSWVETDEIAIRIDPPDSITTYDHIHLYDINGNSLDINGNIVNAKSKTAHIEIKCN